MVTNRSIVIHGGTVMVGDREPPRFSVADVLVEDGVITRIEPGSGVTRAHRIDATGCLVVPGFVDTHRHTWQTAFRGIASDWSASEYAQVLHHRLKPLYSPEDIHLGNLVGRLEALNSGITTMLDWSHGITSDVHADAALAGLVDAQARSVFAYAGGFALPGDDDISASLRRICGSHRSEMVSLALGLRGPQFSSMSTVRADVTLARELGLRVTVHGGSGEWGRNRPVAAMSASGLLDDRTTVVHCNTLADDEIEMMAAAGASASISPSVELQMGYGWPATGRLLKAGVRPSLSIDDCAASGGDMFSTMRSAFFVQRGLDTLDGLEAARQIQCADVVGFATIEGARACGLAERIGAIAVGKAADIAVIRVDGIGCMPLCNPMGTLVQSAHAGLVEAVLVEGRVLKENGSLVGVNIAELRSKLVESRERLIAQANTSVPPHARITLDGVWRPTVGGE